MKKLKIFLILCLICSFLIPNTYAFEINGATFDNVRVYNSDGTLIHSVTDNVNRYITVPKNENISYYLRITGVDDTTVSSGQMLIYTNICTSFRRLQTFDRIVNTIGSITQLQLIANNTGAMNTCTLWNGEAGTLIQNVYSFAYNFQRDSSGNSFLDSKIYWKNSSVINYLSWTQFVNVYLAEYDETVIQNLKQQQINAETNAYLQEQIQKQQETNEKLDEVNDNLGNINDSIHNSDITGSQNTANGFFNNFSDNDYGLSSIITIPLTSIQKITNAICSPLRLPIPFVNKTIDLPCMYDIYNNFPIILNIWQVVSFGIISYAIIVDIFRLVKKFKDPNDDKLEVMDL